MKKTSSGLVIGGVIVAVVLLVGIMMISKYNRFVSGEEQVEAKWAQVENQLQRRFDLIPNLVETVKGYAAHEEAVFAQIAEARAQYGSAASVEEAAAANDELSSALSRLLVIVENYPDLKANQQFKQLMDELAGTENRLTIARQDYNEAVREFNSDVRIFPGNLLAGIFGFDVKDYFEAAESASETPAVDFEN